MMPESIADRYRRWGVDELLRKYPYLGIIPTQDEHLRIGGELHFRVLGPGGEVIEDAYRVELRIPVSFPARYPTARETGGRISETYHKLEDGSLCLAAPTELRLRLGPASTLGDFVEQLVIPYLYGYSSYERNGVAPYGELEHGKAGLRQYFASLFGISDRDAAVKFVRLTSLKKRAANKEPCPCGSHRRLGRCHHRIVNELRERLGRRWFAVEYESLRGATPSSAPRPAECWQRTRLRRRRPVSSNGTRSRNRHQEGRGCRIG
jgi:hypothetical protein